MKKSLSFLAIITLLLLGTSVTWAANNGDNTTVPTSQSGLRVTTLSGDTFVVDTTEAKCLQFGFRHGDRVVDPRSEKLTIMGVAPIRITYGYDVLWYTEDDDNGKVAYWDDGGPRGLNLRKANFRLASEVGSDTKPQIENGVQVTALSGNTFVVDTTAAKCLQFGFRSGDRVVDPYGRKSTIMGVASVSITSGHDILWYAEDDDNGKVARWSSDPDDANLRKEGFRLASEASSDTEPQIENGLQVTALSGDTFLVDTTAAKCLQFGFRSGDRVATPFGDKATIMGVAPVLVGKFGHDVLWFAVDGNDGKVVMWDRGMSEGSNLREEGFRPISKVKSIETESE